MGAFDGKVALVTGASSGIGAAVASELARQGASVGLLARRAERLRSVEAGIAASGSQAISIACDVDRDGDLEREVAELRGAEIITGFAKGFVFSGRRFPRLSAWLGLKMVESGPRRPV